MEIRKLSINDIVPYENNPRKNEDAVEAVMESIKQCGYVAPIIIDEENVILAGHTRFKALQRLGKKEVEVLIRSGLTEEQKKKYRILDNKTNEFAEWDFTKLEEELNDLDFGDFDFNFNFDMPRWSAGKPEANTEPRFTPGGVVTGQAQENDPYLPEGYDNEEIKEYVDNQENYVVKRRIIITYLQEQEEILARGLHLQELGKVVYDIDELFK